MKERFTTKRFRPESLTMIEQVNKIIGEYHRQGLHLTLRQLYYQLVSRNVISNIERSYKNLSALLNDACMAGLSIGMPSRTASASPMSSRNCRTCSG